jgi:hypothetical protein
MWKSRSVVLFVALLAVLSVVSSLGGASASAAAKSSKSKVIVATGGVVCRKMAGTITLTPPERKGGTKPETIVFKVSISKCTTAKSNVSHVMGGSLKVTVHAPTNACGGLIGAKALHVPITWSPKSIHPTAGSFSGFGFVKNNAGYEGFTMPSTGGGASVKGSFAGKNHGARSTITAYTNMTVAKFATACKSKAGLSKYAITSGIVKFS